LKEMFLVINLKRFEELNEMCPQGSMGFTPNQAVLDLQIAIKEFKDVYEANIRPLDQRYFVCNQDEPYAQEVWDVIVKGEAIKND
ncbi:MAG: hypothetical protein GY841_23475, partial [FCB group bacterium]|nr:hypothetical protein [FCB group bacterium]